jgi:hypothetical protein
MKIEQQYQLSTPRDNYCRLIDDLYYLQDLNKKMIFEDGLSESNRILFWWTQNRIEDLQSIERVMMEQMMQDAQISNQ